MVSVHCLQDPQTSFLIKTFIKNRSHGTIHTFKNYFTIVFSVFSNKRYSNTPLDHRFSFSKVLRKFSQVWSPTWNNASSSTITHLAKMGWEVQLWSVNYLFHINSWLFFYYSYKRCSSTIMSIDSPPFF